MLTRRRVLLGLAVVVVVAAAWSAWSVWRTAHDLRDAQSAVTSLRSAVSSDDDDARDRAIADLRSAAASADGHTDGPWWSVMTWTPFAGDDLSGVRALSSSLDLVARDAVVPLADVADNLDGIVSDGQVDLKKVEALDSPVTRAHDVLDRVETILDDEDSSGYAFFFKDQYDEYTQTVSDLASGMDSAETAAKVLPTMLGADGPRDYLLVFQNNAEIRATGGLGGSWARVRTDAGRLEIKKQGGASAFKVADPPLGDLTRGEKTVFGAELGRFFQDANFTPDFPRAAELYNDFWNKKSPNKPIDGVISIDVIGLSYLMDGIGTVEVDGVSLTADNIVEQLLSTSYENPDPDAQDKFFRDAARGVFDAATANVGSSTDLVRGFRQAAQEGRMLVADFDPEVSDALAGTRVEGALRGDDGKTPFVDVALNDATASKMSYYLRYDVQVESVGCSDGVQQLEATMKLRQLITPEAARKLTDFVTGSGSSGTKRGRQFIRIHIIGPPGGSIGDITIDKANVAQPVDSTIEGRPAKTAAVELTSLDDSVVSWTMTSGPGQDGAGQVRVTPSMDDSISRPFDSGC